MHKKPTTFDDLGAFYKFIFFFSFLAQPISLSLKILWPNGLIGRIGRRKPFRCQIKVKKKIFEKLWKLNQKMKIVPYFNNCNRIFFFKAKVLNIWLQIWLPFERHAEGATCQRGEVGKPKLELKSEPKSDPELGIGVHCFTVR